MALGGGTFVTQNKTIQAVLLGRPHIQVQEVMTLKLLFIQTLMIAVTKMYIHM